MHAPTIVTGTSRMTEIGCAVGRFDAHDTAGPACAKELSCLILLHEDPLTTIHLLIPTFSSRLPSGFGSCQDTMKDRRGSTMATTRKELVNRIVESTGAGQRLTRQVVQQFFDEIIVELAQGNRLEFRDFGVFAVTTAPARMARNPRTLERVEVPARRKVVFKPGRLMKEGVNGDRVKVAVKNTP